MATEITNEEIGRTRRKQHIVQTVMKVTLLYLNTELPFSFTFSALYAPLSE
jgi:hypothetical protein